MRKHRGILAIVSLLGLGAVSLAAGWSVLAHRLPDPQSADRDGLVRWMVLRDLSAESPGVRSQLISRLEQELRAGVDLEAIDGAVDPGRRERLWTNVDLLLSDWFSAEADRYAACAAERKPEHVDRRVGDVLSWKTVEALRTRYRAKGQGGDAKLLELCQQRVDRWIQSAKPRQASNMREFVSAIQSNFASRYLRALLEVPRSESAGRTR